MPELPAWPAELELLPPNRLPKRGAGGSQFKAIALWHSLAHDGLWEAAVDTSHDVTARLAVVPMVLEARGLDVSPDIRDRVRRQGDLHGARILRRILDDEIRHVAVGAKHFKILSKRYGKSPENDWKTLVAAHFRGSLKPPFNDSARLAAGLSREYYSRVA